MYSTCLFCNSALGSNESIEHFPVGRRLAFDAAKGRLWVVCRKCARWNLSPLEERWEAIEEAERGYRDTKKRVATDNIGLARLNDGTELVRIGKPMLPEFAAWRYGDQFGRRRRNRILLGTAATIAGGGVVAGVGLGVVSLVGTSTMLSLASIAVPQLFNYWMFGFRRMTIVDTNGDRLKLTGIGLSSCVLSFVAETSDPASRLKVLVPHQLPNESKKFIFSPTERGRQLILRRANAEFEGREAQRVLSVILAATNGFSGTNDIVSAAVARVENAPSTLKLLDSMSDAEKTLARKRIRSPVSNIMILKELPASLRLALEMSLNEESERRALNGELAELENRWKQAEEIAAIADGLFVADGTSNKLDALRN